MEGEKPTRFFFRLEQKRTEKNSFESLFDENGFEKSSSSDIESILVNFYQDLYSKDVLDMQVQTELIDDLQFPLTNLECCLSAVAVGNPGILRGSVRPLGATLLLSL